MLQITSDIISVFKAKKNLKKALPMSAYMKDRFPFLGLATPERKLLLKPAIKLSKSLAYDELQQVIFHLYQQDEREFHYAAIDLLESNINRLPAYWSGIEQYLPLIQTKSWWDSVDSLRKPIAIWTKNNMDQCLPLMMDYLLSSDNMWDRRVAITLQLQWKTLTQKSWLEKAILVNQTDGEFFIQKGIGWALREYSKTNKIWVSDFLQQNSEQLSSLAIREGSKYLHN